MTQSRVEETSPAEKPPEPKAVEEKAKATDDDEGRAKPPVIDGANPENGGLPSNAPPTSELRFPYQVNDGRSITSLKGVLGPGHEVRPEYLSKDKKVAADSLERLVRLKAVIRGM